MGEPDSVLSRGLTLTRSSYYGARFLAQVSQNLLFAGLFVVAGTSDHAGIGMGNLFVAMLIPAITLGMVGGVVADRLGPARGYAVGSFLRFASVFLGIFLIDGVISVWIIAFIYSVASQIFSPAEMAMVKVIDPDKPGRTHSLIVALQTAGQGAGILVLAPALYFLGGPTAIVVGAAGGYALLTGITILLAIRCADAQPATSARKQLAFRQTFSFFRAEPRARDAVATLALKVVTARAIMVAVPIYLERDLQVGQEWIVYLLGVGVLGAVAGLVWASRTMTLDRAPSTMRLSVTGFAVGAFALAALDYTITLAAGYSGFHPIQVLEAQLHTTYLVAFPVAFLLGLCVSGAMISARVALTETAPEGMQARVFATQLWLTETLILLPLALAGIGTEVAGARPTLAVVASLAVLTLGVMEFGRIRERFTRQPEPVLATVPISSD
jgi:MFS family permease